MGEILGFGLPNPEVTRAGKNPLAAVLSSAGAVGGFADCWKKERDQGTINFVQSAQRRVYEIAAVASRLRPFRYSW